MVKLGTQKAKDVYRAPGLSLVWREVLGEVVSRGIVDSTQGNKPQVPVGRVAKRLSLHEWVVLAALQRATSSLD